MKKMMKKNLFLLTSFLLILSMLVGGMTMTGAQEGPLDLSAAEAAAQPDEARTGLALEQMPVELMEMTGLAQADIAGMEDASEGDAHGFTLTLEDGLKSLYAFPNPIKYRDEDGQMRFIETGLTESARDLYAFESTKNNVKTYFPEQIGDGVLLTYADQLLAREYSLAFQPAAAPEGLSANAALRGDLVSYTGVFGDGTELQYEPTKNGVKESIVLERYNGRNAFCFTITAPRVTPELTDDRQTVQFLNEDGEVIFVIDRTFLEDSSDSEDGAKISYDNFYTVERLDGDVWLLTTTADEAFLTDPDTVYPVIVDPTVTIYRSFIEDAVLPSSGSGSVNNALLRVGKNGSTEYVSWLRLKNIWDFSYLSHTKVYNARFYVKMPLPSNNTVTMSLYDVNNTENLTPTQIVNKGISWLKGEKANYIELDIPVGPASTNNPYFNFNITSYFKLWLKQETDGGTISHKRGILMEAKSNATQYKDFMLSSNNADTSYFKIDYYEDTSLEIGTYYIKNKKSGLYLDVPNSSTTNGKVVEQHSFNGGKNQQWKVEKFTGAVYELRPLHHPTAMLHLSNSAGRSPIQIHTTLSYKNHWRIIKHDNGSYRIMNYETPYMSMIPEQGSSLSGKPMESWFYGAGGHAEWIFEKVPNVKADRTYHIKKHGTWFLEPGTKTGNNYEVVQNAFKGTDKQRWKFHLQNDGSFRIVSEDNGLSLGEASGPNAEIFTQPWTGTGTNSQKWFLFEKPDGKIMIINKASKNSFTTYTLPGAAGNFMKIFPEREWNYFEIAEYEKHGLAGKSVTVYRNNALANSAPWVSLMQTAAQAWNNSGAGVSISTGSGSGAHTFEVVSHPHHSTNDGTLNAHCDYVAWDSNKNLTQSVVRIFTNGDANLGSSSVSNDYKRAIIVHEMGHLFWLSDEKDSPNPNENPDPPSIMNYYYVSKEGVTTPRPFDVRNIKIRYD